MSDSTQVAATPAAPAEVPVAVRRAAAKPVSFGQVVGRSPFVPYLFLLPGLALFVVFFAWPAVEAVEASFTDYSIVNPLHVVGFANYTELFHDEVFLAALGHSLIVMVGLLPFSVAIPLWLAILVNRKLRGIQVFRAVYFLPVITSMITVAVAWNYVFADKGVLNWLVATLGLSDAPIHFLLDPHWALASVILVEGWKGIGTYMMIYLAGLQAIPGDLYEAAEIDGAGAWQRFTRVTLPLMRPFMAVALAIEMVNALQVFTSVYVLTQGGPNDHTTTAGYFVWSQAFQHYRFGYASAAGVVVWAILIALALVNHRLTNGKQANTP
ncbi:carbohydrate ABC transporter permease [Labedaea rhizosphaerae]|uniref:Carbohydrate ABC transporter membrane protein 1 (CUT1 family) n=1 Tax=Labedaea rhizosphaerae TaxID=598644 RepID=A0A4R6S6L6_LABRH|nr:sugar ABC transporter permease [Labedaea rhizosphaerae]TDP94837.1 carbohydrate ABC transporter membrane protein 1 (CUT1 family) [Labedaea rhizosphaerae]